MSGEPVPSLASRLPPPGAAVDDDALLDLFIGWVAETGIALYPAQEEAILEVMSGNHVILATPTGSGKSLVALAMHFRDVALGRRSFYTSPIKALVNEKFLALCRDLGPENVGMMTGDSTVNRDAPVICCTAEILANMALRQGSHADADSVCMDEFHYYSDRDRGVAWQLPLLVLERATYLLMSATLGEAAQVEATIEARTGCGVTRVESDERPVPLEFSYSKIPLHEAVEDLVKRGRAPIYQVNFTQRACAEQAQALMSADYCSKEEKKAIARELSGARFDTPYGKVVQRYVKHGVGLHHGGLLPKYRLMVERLSRLGMLKVICGTDTLGVGVNVPIRTVLFTQLCKYDGEKTRILSVRDFKQIAGRAGRKGYDDRGYVVCQAPAHVIDNQRAATRAASQAAGGKKKKFVRSQPPKRGYVPWNSGTFQELLDKPPEPLTSSFSIDHGMIVGIMQREDAWASRAGGYGALMELLTRSHEHEGSTRRLRRHSRQLFKALRRAGILEVVPRQHGRGQEVVVAEDLQADFSLFHSLSLFLLDALTQLDPEHATYALDVMTLVESILEHPRAILIQQERRLKDALVAEMKANGIEYEERMERLEQVTYPKPRAEFIYAAFDRFGETHPWVAAELIRPKSIVREMLERYTSFNEYVKDLGLERIEGVLLRYVSGAFKTLVQSVPDAFKTDEVRDAIAYLRTTLERVDSSLVREWERMVRQGEDAGAADEPERPFDISRDARGFQARVRSELHRLVRALSVGDWEEAAGFVRQDEDDPWTAARFEQALAPFLETYERLIFDHSARLADLTRVRQEAPHQWRVSQVLRDPEGDDLWGIEGVVDLRDDTDPSGPLVQVLQIAG